MNNKQDTRTKLLYAAIDLIWRASFGSVSVDDICVQAGVLKGSFYHFFPSKVDLAIEAVKFNWEEYRPEIDRIYDAEKEPLQRISDHCDLALKRQKEMLKTCGFVPGCPVTVLGSEQSTQNEPLREVIDSHLKYMMRYFSQAISDAIESGAIPKTNIKRKTDEIFSLYLGTFTYARITNDLQPIRNMKKALLTLLGTRVEELAH
jgi:TetR/AcrR family transcriptional repressor of nem operon